MIAPTYPADGAVLLETRVERRDGGPWLTGTCSFCWERVGFREADVAKGIRCKNGHALRVVEHQCVGACARHHALDGAAHAGSRSTSQLS